MFRSLLIITLPFLLISCGTKEGVRISSPKDRIITFENGGIILGRGVMIGSGIYLTAKHVLSQCEQIGRCEIHHDSNRFDSKGLQRRFRGEAIVLGGVGEIQSDNFVGERIYALASRSGAWIRLDGKILSIAASYEGYDNTLRTEAISGALLTDIVFFPGESGTPIWTLSGGLVGIVSAVDKKAGKSYIVR